MTRARASRRCPSETAPARRPSRAGSMKSPSDGGGASGSARGASSSADSGRAPGLLLEVDRGELGDLVLQQVIDDAGLRLALARLHALVFQALAHQLGDVARDDLQAAREEVLRERVLQVGRALVAILVALGERLADDVLQLGLDLRVLRRDRRDLGLAHQLDGLVVGLAVEQALPGEHLLEHDADREDVGAVVDLLAARRLGRQVAELALDHAGVGRSRSGWSPWRGRSPRP